MALRDTLRFLMGLSLALAVFFPAAEARASLHRGAEAPDFKLRDLDGNEVSLKEFRGKVVVVSFWATYCMGCKAEIPHLNRFYQKYENKEAVLLGLSMDNCPVDDIRKFADRWNIRYPILQADRNTTRAWRVRALPITYLVDPQGIIQRTYIGPEATGLLDRHTRQLLGR